MKTIEIKKDAQINAGSFIVSIGTYNTGDVAIISKSSGEFSKLKDIRKGGKLAKVKRRFKRELNNRETFNFQFMTEEKTLELIKLLKSK